MKNEQVQGWDWGVGLLVIIVLALAGAFLLAPLVAGPTFDKVWPEVVKGLPAAFVALVIGVIAAGIAYRQMKIADHQRRVAADKLSFDLFKERYAVFTAVMAAFQEAMDWGVMRSSGDAFQALCRQRPQGKFLFGPVIGDYLDEVVRHCSYLISIKQATRDNTGIVPTGFVGDLFSTQAWIEAELQQGALNRFSPYLDFSRWRPGAQ